MKPAWSMKKIQILWGKEVWPALFCPLMSSTINIFICRHTHPHTQTRRPWTNLIGLIRNFSRSPLLFPPVELIALEQWSGGELGAKVSCPASAPLCQQKWDGRGRGGGGWVGGNDGGVLGTGRCTVAGRATESWRRVGESRKWVKLQRGHICPELSNGRPPFYNTNKETA